MFARTKQGNRGQGLVRSSLLILWIAASLACATTPTAPAARGPSALSDVMVETDGSVTVVSLVGLTEPVYNAFQQEDPARVVIDLASVTPGEVADIIAVYDGTVDEVTLAGFDSDGTSSTRIELSLATGASYEVVSLEDRLEVRVQADALDTSSIASVQTETETDVWAPVASTSSTEAAPEVVVTEEPTVPATTLYGVSTESDASSMQTTLLADGSIEGATWFTLENPSRLVVDLPEMSSQVDQPRIEVSNDWVQQVRVGQHDDKVRVVLDGAEGAELATAQLVALPTGLWLGLGSATVPSVTTTRQHTEARLADVEADTETTEAWVTETATEEMAQVEDVDIEAATARIAEGTTTEEIAQEGATTEVGVDEEASEPVAIVEETVESLESEEIGTQTAKVWAEEAGGTAAEEAASETLAVYGVQLESEGNLDRVVIVTEGPAEYVTTQPAPGTTVVSIRGATIDPDATVRIAPEQPGTVSLVTAFQQPEAREPEVRVVITGAEGVKSTVTQQGAMIFLEFPRGAEVASALPVLRDTASVDAAVPAALDPSSDSVEILAEGGLVDGKTYTGRRISLDFKDVEIDDVLRLIAEVSDLNIIAGDEVNGKVTIRLVDVPWDQALDVILLTRGLGFVRVGSVLRIAPSNLLKAEEEARLQERRAKEKLEDLVVKLQPVNYADVEEIEKMVKRLLTPRGSVDVDERTNTVILKDIASVIDEATALIKAIDTQTPQVMIEAKIVEANLDFGKEIGSVWASGIQNLNNGFDDASGSRTNERLGLGNDILFHDNPNLLPDAVGALNNVAVSNPISSVPTGLLNLGAFLLDERLNLEAQLQAAESYGEGKVISSPRIVTLDNRKASIEQGVSIPFQTFENGDAKLEFIDAVLRLDVTPHITADKSIIMKLEIQRNAPDDSVQTPTGSPAIAKNEAETETLVKDGQTLVIGGIYIVDQSELESRVPYFHKIPLLGNAFKNTEVRDIRKELLVFVTPRIVVNPELGS